MNRIFRLSGLRQDVDICCLAFPETVAFYRDRLGLPVVSQWAGVARFDGGGGRWLTLWRADPLEGAAACAAGRHSGASFLVDDIAALYEALGVRGVAFASRPCRQPWGSTMVNLVAPDGHLVTLVQQRAATRDWSEAPLHGDAGRSLAA